MKRQLSPSAQTVWSAYESILENECVVTTTDERALAAALHEVARQVVPDDLELLKRSGEAVRLNRLSICRQIHAIADELETQ